MKIILVTEIHGITTAIKTLANALDATIVDPYQGVIRSFVDETQAYQTFISECGHDKYNALVESAIQSVQGKAIIIGFSAGASAAWKATQSFDENTIAHVIGFYPSQIRYSLDVQPQCPVTLIFPHKENHFEVSQVIQNVSKSPTVECIKTAFKHGFMNPLSDNYHSEAFDAFNKVFDKRTTLANVTYCRHLLSSAKEFK